MKILIISDTHGRIENLKMVLWQEKPLDLLIHLGDIEGDEKRIEMLADCPVKAVAGNNDFFSNLPGEREIRIGKYKVLLTHGHYYYVNAGIRYIKGAALDRGIDIAMFGHTHRPILEQDKGVTVLNPGSLSYPRQERRRPSYIVMELDENGEASFMIKYI